MVLGTCASTNVEPVLEFFDLRLQSTFAVYPIFHLHTPRKFNKTFLISIFDDEAKFLKNFSLNFEEILHICTQSGAA